jgi:hypothetical protein
MGRLPRRFPIQRVIEQRPPCRIGIRLESGSALDEGNAIPSIVEAGEAEQAV